jgi:DNA-directed RNA polymerase subunit RPC12/RpoP
VFLGSFELQSFIVMSYPSTEIICGKCGTTISRIINLRPIRDILRGYDGKCKTCGNNLNPADFTIEIEKI